MIRLESITVEDGKVCAILDTGNGIITPAYLYKRDIDRLKAIRPNNFEAALFELIILEVIRKLNNAELHKQSPLEKT